MPSEKQRIVIMPRLKRGETNAYKFLSLLNMAVLCSENGGSVQVLDEEKVILGRSESYECAVPNTAVEDKAVEVNSVQVMLYYKMHTLNMADANTALAI
eukprot:13002231-Ditylum_brightwellii.AAC.1